VKASDLITDLQQLVREYGDLEVVDEQDDAVMVNYDEGEEGEKDPAFVIS